VALRAKIKIEADVRDAKKNLDSLEKELKSVDGTTEELGSTMGRLGGVLGGVFKVAAVAAAAAVGALVAGLVRAISLGETYTDALNLQRGALAKFGTEADSVSESLEKQALALERTTSATKEEVLEVQTIIAAFAKSEEQIRSLTAATLDFAAGTARGPKEAAEQVAKSFGTASNALAEYNVTIETVAGSNERAAEITNQLSAAFNGLAEASAEGRFAGLTSEFNNLLTVIGSLANESNFLTGLLVGTTGRLEETADAAKKGEGFWGKFGATLQNISKRVLPGFAQEWIEVHQELGLTALVAEDLAKRQAELTAATEAATQAAKDYATESERLRDVMSELGLIVVPDTTKGLKENAKTLADVTAAFDRGLISLDSYLDQYDRLTSASLNLRSTTEQLAGTIHDREIPAVAAATDAINQQTDATNRATSAKERNTAATNSQAAAESSLSSISRRGGFADNLLGGKSTFATIGGGTFQIPPKPVVGINGRVEPG
jgi:hypothetical protein